MLGVRRWRELVADRKKMEGHCSTDQNPQWAVVPMEEEKEEEKKRREEEEEVSAFTNKQTCQGWQYYLCLHFTCTITKLRKNAVSMCNAHNSSISHKLCEA